MRGGHRPQKLEPPGSDRSRLGGSVSRAFQRANPIVGCVRPWDSGAQGMAPTLPEGTMVRGALSTVAGRARRMPAVCADAVRFASNNGSVGRVVVSRSPLLAVPQEGCEGAGEVPQVHDGLLEMRVQEVRVEGHVLVDQDVPDPLGPEQPSVSSNSAVVCSARMYRASVARPGGRFNNPGRVSSERVRSMAG
jgi:hypothetical protein